DCAVSRASPGAEGVAHPLEQCSHDLRYRVSRSLPHRTDSARQSDRRPLVRFTLQPVELAAVPLGRSSLPLVAQRRRDPQLLREVLARFLPHRIFFKKRRGRRGAETTRREAADSDMKIVGAFPDAKTVPYSQWLGPFRLGLADQHLPTGNRFTGVCPGLEETRGPEPDIEPYGVVGHSLTFTTDQLFRKLMSPEPASSLMVPPPFPMVPERWSLRSFRTFTSTPPRSISPDPVSSSTSAPKVEGTESVMVPDPVLPSRVSMPDRRPMSTSPLPVSSDIFAAFTVPTVMLPEPELSASFPVATWSPVMSPEPVSTLTPPS